MSKRRSYHSAQTYYTVDDAFERSLWLHYCGDHRGAHKLLCLIAKHATKEEEPTNG